MPEKTPRRWLTYLGYAAFFGLCLLVSAYLTFPMQAIKPRVVQLLEEAVQHMGPAPGRYGVPAEVQVDKLRMHRLSGIEIERLSVRLASADPDPAPTWDIDRARVRLHLLPLLLGRWVIGFDVDAYDGSIVGEALLVNRRGDGDGESDKRGSADKRLAQIEAEADGLQLGKIQALVGLVGVPVSGEAAATVDLKLGKSPKEHVGTIAVRGQGLSLGPGERTIPGFGALSLPTIDMGQLVIDADVADGKAKVKPAKLDGKDLKAAANLNVTLRQPVGRSTTTGALEFKMDEAFLAANTKFQPIFDMLPQLKRAKSEQGAYRFKLSGMLGSLRPQPDRNAKVSL